MIKHLSEEDFNSEIASGVTLVDFSAEWCGPCKMLLPILEELDREMTGKAVIAKVDIDNDQSLASSFGITSVPTMILFKDGKEVDRIMGVRDKDSLVQFINSAL